MPWLHYLSRLLKYDEQQSGYTTLHVSVLSYWQFVLDEASHPWGIKVERVEIKDVKLPLQLQRAMAAEAEASREARAKVSFIISPECTKLWKGRVETYHLQKFPVLFCNTCRRLSYS